ncbi:MurR/RpiR family transcriptional regulator [Goodfellowiella coeruleoviolacea]|uniref:Transcriptional regulator, RpiR family n=1 Tax=Goodfellowiella coeruleoviolacea TaxID=334858 RepID=A0AAE3KE75_9PSEU|nr:MurR/RpiR family transcriptional regulator [Goodfellowiella coeruleoviolacea]MCP2165006.1 transcriptional regulator, RpiR family [Goodfellowiella coeruleoviolacea]
MTETGDAVEHWLRGRVPERGLKPKAAAVLEVLLSQPRRACFGSAADLAELAGVNVATVTRTAQALGFAGWPALQQELRARYLSSLSASDVAEHHEVSGSPALASLHRDLDGIGALARRVAEVDVAGLATAIASAGRTLVVAKGSYAAVGAALTHNARLAGYPVELASDDADLANALARLGEGDVLLAISFWRLYQSTVLATEQAHARGARVFVLTDVADPALVRTAEQVLLVPAEGVAFFPSLTPGLALAQAVVAQLAAVDPARTRAHIEAAEAQWLRLGLLHRQPRRP